MNKFGVYFWLCFFIANLACLLNIVLDNKEPSIYIILHLVWANMSYHATIYYLKVNEKKQ
jgi:hypothetical protein